MPSYALAETQVSGVTFCLIAMQCCIVNCRKELIILWLIVQCSGALYTAENGSLYSASLYKTVVHCTLQKLVHYILPHCSIQWCIVHCRKWCIIVCLIVHYSAAVYNAQCSKCCKTALHCKLLYRS